jgi:aryl-phospho-beta-D-glucosidase BglC (GH1 family)
MDVNMHKSNIVVSLIFLLAFNSLLSQDFLTTSGRDIVDGSGNPVILRAMGLGGWMVMEGYMMQTASFASPQHQIKKKISDLIGEEDTELFFDTWQANHCRKIDIDSLASWGFNSVRLPLHYNLFTLPIEEEPSPGTKTWLDKGFVMVDSVLAWCAANEMYLILDLHAAPGGQGYDQAISDYDPSKPSLWESVANQSKTIALWRKLADRYKDEPWIGGYDLLNETNWNLPGNAQLKQLYVDIIQTIRAVDNNHIIFIEGNWFANDFTGLTPPFDDNMVYSFHKYWSHNNKGSIQWMLDLRNQYNIPIWCGESGENSNVWFTDAIKLFEANDIGWAWWPMKKVESISCPLSIIKPDGYQYLLDYWEGRANKPSADYAKSALMELADNARLENCRFQPDVVDALIRQVQIDITKPYANNVVPGIVPSVHYDMGRNGEAYLDKVVADYHVSTGNYTAWNNGWAYRNDGVDIELSKDDDGYPFSIGFVETDEWLKYTLNVVRSDSFNLKLRLASASNSALIQLVINNQVLSQKISVPNTGGWYNWQTMDLGKIYLSAGSVPIRLNFLSGGVNLNQIEFIATSTGGGSGTPPASFVLKQNYPNPFNAGTKIPFYLSDPAQVKISIYDTRGSLVTELGNMMFEAGERSVQWDGKSADGKSLSSGIYYYAVKVGDRQEIKSMLYLR